MTCHVCAETTHVVAAPHGFACVLIGPTCDLVVYSGFRKHPFGGFGTTWSKFALSRYFRYWLLQQLVLLHKPLWRVAPMDKLCLFGVLLLPLTILGDQVLPIPPFGGVNRLFPS